MKLTQINFTKEQQDVKLDIATIQELLDFISLENKIENYDLGIIDNDYSRVFPCIKNSTLYNLNELPTKYLTSKFNNVELSIFKISENLYTYLFLFQ